MVVNDEIQTFSPNDPLIYQLLSVRAKHAEQQKRDYSHVFRRKSVCDIIRLSCIILGTLLTYAAETAFVSPLLLEADVQYELMTLVWSLSPIVGFICSPLLGSLSDRCRLPLGRRRPMIIVLCTGIPRLRTLIRSEKTRPKSKTTDTCIGILIGLIFIPYGKYFGVWLGDSPVAESSMNYTFTIMFIVLGTILIDSSINMMQVPCRAYILDVSTPTDHAKVLSSFTLYAGLGATIGYALGGIDWETTQFGSFLGGNVQTVFVIVTVLFLICSVVTITSFREIPLPLMENDELLRPLTAATIKKELKNRSYGALHDRLMNLSSKSQSVFITNDAGDIRPISNGYSASIEDIRTIVEDEDEKPINLKAYTISVVKMPKAMKILCLTNLLCWMADISYTLYFTDFVGQAVFNGSPTASRGSKEALLYEKGVRFGCFGLSIYALSCAIYSSLIRKLINIFNTRIVYMAGLLTFSVGMTILASWPTKTGVLVFSIVSGILYSTMYTIPYILIAQYHLHACFEIKDGEKVNLKQSRGLGTDIAIVNNMVFLAQLIVSLGIGSIISFAQSTVAVLYVASFFAAVASLCALKCLYLEYYFITVSNPILLTLGDGLYSCLTA